MSDQTIPGGIDRRAPAPASVGTTATMAGIGGLAIATVDYLFHVKQVHAWVQPDDAFIIMWATALAPSIHLMIKIWNNWLSKLAGERA